MAARRSSQEVQGSVLRASGAASGVYDVHLLVTRHGLSCTNIVEKWVNKFDAGRRLMHDPLLGGVGVLGCREGRSAVESYLKNRSLPPFDAVLSSVLARAMETALLTYPQQAAPLYVAPFIREYAAGLSNDPKEPAGQLADLNTSVPYDFHVDYHWVDEFGSQKGSWDQFLHFLEQFFLPDLISRLKKPPGSKIVLPVVTHSLFMRDSDVGVKCKDAFKSNPSKKPLNNQVVDMTYAFHSGEAPFYPGELAALAPTAGPGKEASSVAFTIQDCGEPRAVGQWGLAGKHEGRPAYANVADSQVVIRWSRDASAWQLVTVPAWGVGGRGATVLYESESEALLQGVRHWKIAAGYFGGPAASGPVPQVAWKGARYSLRETSSPCEGVYPGVRLTDAAGSVRAPICLKDVGDSCIEPIKKYSWAPGVLWQQTYESLIGEESETITRLKSKVAYSDHDLQMRRLKLEQVLDPWLRQYMLDGIEDDEREHAFTVQDLAAHERQRAKLADATCWSGGKPDTSGGMPDQRP